MADFPDRILQTVNRYRMLSPGDRVGVGVSGGADSVCLLHVLLELRSSLDLSLSVLHVNHHLRGAESQADAEFVHKLAQQLGLPFRSRDLDLASGHGNLEQEARRGRYLFFRELVRGGEIDKIALGHTRSDQAETVLFRLLRGAGSAGLAGIRPLTDLGVVRPLLEVTRADVEAWLRLREVSWREDSTNRDLRFDRNRIRRRLLPQLQAEWNPNLLETLAQTADWAFEEERYWALEIERLAGDWVRFEKDAATLDCAKLCTFPAAVVRRLLRWVVERVKDDLLGVSFSHIEAIRHLASVSDGSGRLALPGVEAVRSFQWLRLFRPPAAGASPPADWEMPVTVPGRYVIPPAAIELELVSNRAVYNSDGIALDPEKVGNALVLRSWRPGDRYQRLGHSAPEKLKTLFQEYRVPSWERPEWPIITAGGFIIWVRKFGAAAQFAAGAESRTVLRIRESAC